MAGSTLERLIGGNDRRVECLGECDVRRVVSADIIPQVPDPRQQLNEPVPPHAKHREIFERLRTASRGDVAKARRPSHRLGDLGVQEVWCVNGVGVTEPCGDLLAERGREQVFDCGGSVEDDQPAFR